jgi:hypothetical protein
LTGTFKVKFESSNQDVSLGFVVTLIFDN